MPGKDFALDNGQAFTVYKRRGSRNLRLSISAAGKVRVTIPAWAPYKAGVDFARSRQAWLAQQVQQPSLLRHGQAIGKGHHLELQPEESVTRVSSRITGTVLRVRFPAELSVADAQVQAAAHKLAIKSLRLQAEQLLPQRLQTLADRHGFAYRSMQVKQLTGRWGSCDQQRRIVLSLFLMQLPWDLIDYVILHELVHTQVLKHGPDFWQALEQVRPGAKAARKQLHGYRPVLAAD